MDAAGCAAESHAMRRKSALVQTPQRASALMGQATFDRSYKLKGKERLELLRDTLVHMDPESNRLTHGRCWLCR